MSRKSAASHTQYDMVIAGGGIVGPALGCLLGAQGVQVAVVEKSNPQALLADGFDGRVSAISYASVLVLQAAGAWEHMAPHAQPIWEIRVCEQEYPTYVHFDHREFDGEPLGYMLENRYLRRGLYQAMEANPNVTFIGENGVAKIEQHPGYALATLEDGCTLQAPLIAAADGRFSKLRAAAGIRHQEHRYGQTAIVCVLKHEKPLCGIAIEKFLPPGPFAVLPMRDNHCGIVWTERDDMAKRFLALSDAEFLRELQKRLGTMLGTLTLLPQRWSYPLALLHAQQYWKERLVLVGDSAHGIHPIAGQGANLGLRDVAVLGELIGERRKLGLDIGAADVLQHYEQWRRFDVFAMMAATDGINRLFANNQPVLKAARNIGMASVNRMPVARRFFMKHAMGMLGQLPKVLEAGKI